MDEQAKIPELTNCEGDSFHREARKNVVYRFLAAYFTFQPPTTVGLKRVAVGAAYNFTIGNLANQYPFMSVLRYDHQAVLCRVISMTAQKLAKEQGVTMGSNTTCISAMAVLVDTDPTKRELFLKTCFVSLRKADLLSSLPLLSADLPANMLHRSDLSQVPFNIREGKGRETTLQFSHRTPHSVLKTEQGIDDSIVSEQGSTRSFPLPLRQMVQHPDERDARLEDKMDKILSLLKPDDTELNDGTQKRQDSAMAYGCVVCRMPDWLANTDNEQYALCSVCGRTAHMHCAFSTKERMKKKGNAVNWTCNSCKETNCWACVEPQKGVICCICCHHWFCKKHVEQVELGYLCDGNKYKVYMCQSCMETRSNCK